MLHSASVNCRELTCTVWPTHRGLKRGHDLKNQSVNMNNFICSATSVTVCLHHASQSNEAPFINMMRYTIDEIIEHQKLSLLWFKELNYLHETKTRLSKSSASRTVVLPWFTCCIAVCSLLSTYFQRI